MSRTYRRKQPRDDHYWLLAEWVCIGWKRITRLMVDPKSEKGKELLAKYHSDAYRNFKEPGPAYWRNLTAERPHRRHCKNELRKYASGLEVEVILDNMPHLEYWT